jgi:hypothetical protein
MEIIVTGDLLRPNPDGTSNQQSNIVWFYKLMSYSLSRPVGGVPVLPCYAGKGEGSFDSELFYRLNGLEVSVENWARLYDAEDVSPEAKTYFRAVFADKLIVGFELPRLFMRLLEEVGAKYLDFIIHPVRFLDDVFFGVKSNDETVRQYLCGVSITEERFYVQAGLHRATLSLLPSKAIEENSCLLVGQTAADRSLISDGRIVAFTDFAEEVAKRFEYSRKVYFKPHPYASDAYEVFQFLSRFGDVELIEENIYKLLADERIREVVSISSSVGYESPYFGRPASFLLGEPSPVFRGLPRAQQQECYFPVYDDFFEPSFWQAVLAPFFSVSDCPHVRLPAKTSRLRISIQNHWGYNFLDFDILLENVERDRRKQFEFLWRDTFTVAEFLGYDDLDFIRKAYLGILKREPEHEGLERYLRRLREGDLTKESLLARLRFSREGIEKGVRVGGLLTSLVKQVPVSCTLLLRKVFR